MPAANPNVVSSNLADIFFINRQGIAPIVVIMPAAKLAKKPYNMIVWEFIITYIAKNYSYGYVFIMMNIYITMIYY